MTKVNFRGVKSVTYYYKKVTYFTDFFGFNKVKPVQ